MSADKRGQAGGGGSKRPPSGGVRRRPRSEQPKDKPRGRPDSRGRSDNRSRSDDRGKSRGKQPEGKVWRKPDAAPAVTAPMAAEEKELLAAASAKVGPGGYRQFSDIPAHKLGRKLRPRLYKLAKGLPADASDLSDRIKAAATGSTASLVTGFGEGTIRASIRGALQGRGALVVLQDLLDQLVEQDWLEADERSGFGEELDAVIAALNTYLGELVRDRDRLAKTG